MKRCAKCGVEKDTACFTKRSDSKDGLYWQCRDCVREYSRSYYVRNQERLVEKSRAYYREDPARGIAMTRAWQDRNQAVIRAWRERNRDRINARQRANHDPVLAAARFKAYYDANKEQQRARSREWAKANPEKRRANQQRRIARKADAAGADYTTDAMIEARVAVYGGCCFYCGAAGAETVDHRIPLSRGGSHWPANLVPACGPCNFSKNTQTESEFRQKVAA